MENWNSIVVMQSSLSGPLLWVGTIAAALVIVGLLIKVFVKSRGAEEYIAALRALCDMEEHERLHRDSEIVRAAQESLRSFGMDPMADMSFSEMLNKKTAILVTRIGNAISGLGLSVKKMPRIVLLPTGDLNAWATVAPNGEPVCVLDPGLSATLLYFSWSLAEGTTLSPDATVERDYVKCCFGAIAACEELVFRGHEPARRYLRSVNFAVDRSWFMFGVFH